uniref:Serine protease n=1 Tax=Gnathostoma spinigerum TaxID=75299 RepID=B1PL21_9BILA|nr:serine protease [Gnathostoma spinigerum]
MKLIPALFLIFQRYITVLAYLTKPPITTLTALNSTVLDKPNTIIRIIGGTEANETVWPWQVKIIYKRLNSMKYFLCGGSLITNKHVLSAAHCLDDADKQNSFIVIGSVYGEQSSKAVIRHIDKATIHPDFRASDKRILHDIAIVQLGKPVVFNDRIRSINLPHFDTKLTVGCGIVTGWGIYDDRHGISPHVSSVLRQATIHFISYQQCNKARMRIRTGGFQISTKQICAGGLRRGTAEGDSGGPLQVLTKNGDWYQVGITSFGVNSDEGVLDQETYPGVYTRVSSYCTFISRTIGNPNTCSVPLAAADRFRKCTNVSSAAMRWEFCFLFGALYSSCLFLVSNV